MKILIDMQGWQSESKNRGIGRYTIDFVSSIVNIGRSHDIFLLFNASFEESIIEARKLFGNRVATDHFVLWHPLTPTKWVEGNFSNNRQISESIFCSVVENINPDVIHLTSYFEGYLDDAVTTICTKSRAIKSVTIYDLIPLLDSQSFLSKNYAYSKFYLEKVNELNDADLLLCISEHTKNTLDKHLKISSTKVTSIGSAVNSAIWSPKPHQNHSEEVALGEFFMYCGGFDDRKNVKTLIKAYSAFLRLTNSETKLVLAGHIQQGTKTELDNLISSYKISNHLIIFTGSISDEKLARLYQNCKLFVFPSLNEGFGLPVLEAMQSGAPVIASKTSSLPEIIKVDKYLFDPLDADEIANLLIKASQDHLFMEQLTLNSQIQSRNFSWEITAERALSAWQTAVTEKKLQTVPLPVTPATKLKLAVVTPLPPEKTGVADFSAEVLVDLSAYYEITLVNDELLPSFTTNSIVFPVISVETFQTKGNEFDRILYHVGNSHFHKHMPQLLSEFPGVVELHDFFLGGLFQSLLQELKYSSEGPWFKELLSSAGPIAALRMLKAPEPAKETHPSNFGILSNAKGIITHSEYSIELFRDYFKNGTLVPDWSVVKLPNRNITKFDKYQVREKLGIPLQANVIASLGSVYPTKLNIELLEAWIESGLAENKNNYLVFVGENHGGLYGKSLLSIISENSLNDRVIITGYIDFEEYSQYLSVIDVAVQLRGKTRGETSGAVSDCLSMGVPMIVNSIGSFREIPDEVCFKINEQFTISELATALNLLTRDQDLQQKYKHDALGYSREVADPKVVAGHIFIAIERYYLPTIETVGERIKKITKKRIFEQDQLAKLARGIRLSIPAKRAKKNIFIDISATVRQDHGSGIERVAKSLIWELEKLAPNHISIVPIYLCDMCAPWHHHIATRFLANNLEIPVEHISDQIIIPESGDVILTVDISGEMFVNATDNGLFQFYKAHGVTLYSIVYDLLPIEIPEVFPRGTDVNHASWLHAVAEQDVIFCISKSVKSSFTNWIRLLPVANKPVSSDLPIHTIPLGCDIKSATLAPQNQEDVFGFSSLHKDSTLFMMVGTIEPRKGYFEALSALENAIAKGSRAVLVIVGREGWIGLDESERRDIPITIEKILNHKLLNKNIFWFNTLNDADLSALYGQADYLVANSYGEGFGLPLIEAAANNLAVICRDIPVFREVADETTLFYSSESELCELFFSLQKRTLPINSSEFSKKADLPTWSDTAQVILEEILKS